MLAASSELPHGREIADAARLATIELERRLDSGLALSPTYELTDAMFEILTVCTGNICRSPLAAVVLRSRLADQDVSVSSAGTHGLDAAPMTTQAVRLATDLGADPEDANTHRSRFLREQDLVSPDLIIALSREHRRRILDMAPARMTQTFPAREFARLAEAVSDDDIRHAAEGLEAPAERMRAAVQRVSSMRGAARPPRDPRADDVVDPYRRSWATYQRSAAELVPAIDQIVRVLHLVNST